MKVLLMILILLFNAKSFSQPQLFSLEDCFAAAEKNSIRLQKSRNEVEKNYIDKKTATYNLLPSAYANAEHIFSSGRTINPVTNDYVTDNFSGGDVALSFQLTIFSGFTALNTIKASRFKIKAGESAWKKSELEVFSAITMAYAKVMYSKEQAVIIKNNALHTKNELEIIQEKINLGKLSKSDYYTLNTYYKNAQAALIAAENDSTNAVNELKYLIGLTYDTPFMVQDIDNTIMKAIAKKDFNVADVLNRVLNTHPVLQQAMFGQKVAEMNVKVAKGNLLPRISLAGNVFSNYNLTDNFNGNHISLNEQLNNNFGKTAGLVLQIPIFSNYEDKALIEKEKINLANAKLVNKEAENEVIKNTQQLLADFIAAKQEYLLQHESLREAELAYEGFEEKYKLGYISSLDLTVAKDRLYTQQVSCTQTKYKLYFKYKLIQLLIE